jgi:outer membrane protein OmpA-like peptidoglycan-associated protein
MGANLIDIVRGLITPEMLEKVAASTGESPEGAKKALHGALPTIFAALVHRSSTADGASSVFAMISQSAVSGMVGKLTGSTEGPERGRGLVGAIFGGRDASAGEALAKSSGVKSSSAARILEFATPLVAGVLGKEVVSRKMDAGDLTQTLAAHKQAILDDPSTPAGLKDALGAAPVSPPGAPSTPRTEAPSRFHEVEQRAHDVEQKLERGARDVGLKVERGARDLGQRIERGAHDVEERAATAAKGNPMRIVLPLIAVGLAVWGIVMATRSHVPTGVTAPQPPSLPTLEAPPAPTVPQGPAISAPPAPAPTAGISLPNGSTLDVTPNSAEAAFAGALADPAVHLPHVFSFDDLTFSPGSAAPNPEASRTLDALGATLKAYPSAAVRIEGFASQGRRPAPNRALAESRARAVRDNLVAQGVAPERIHTTGRGRHAAMARRTAVVLLHR